MCVCDRGGCRDLEGRVHRGGGVQTPRQLEKAHPPWGPWSTECKEKTEQSSALPEPWSALLNHDGRSKTRALLPLIRAPTEAH